MDAIIERMSGGCPEHPLLKIVENDDLDRSPSALKRRRTGHRSCGAGATIPLPRQHFERLPSTDRFFRCRPMARFGCRRRLGPYLGPIRGASHHIGVPKTPEEGTTWTAA